MKIAKIILLSIFIISFFLLCKSLFLGYYPDFSDYYFGPKVLLHGGNPYLARENFFTPFVYPPFVLFFFIPLTLFPFQTAEIIWTSVSIILLFSSVLILLNMYKQKIYTISSLSVGILVCWFFPVKFSLGMGQINIFILFLVTLGMFFLNKKNNEISGFLFGMSLLLKLFPVLLLFYLVVKKQWRALGALLLTLGIVMIGVYILLNSSTFFYFSQHIFPGYFSGWKGDYYNQSFSGVLIRSGIILPIAQVVRILFLVIGIVTTFLMIFIVRRKHSLYTTNISVGAIMAISLLVNNFSWQHHFVWLLFPFISVFFGLKKIDNKKRNFVLLGIAYLLTASNFKNPQAVPVILQSHVFYGAFLLWILCIYLLNNKKLTA